MSEWAGGDGKGLLRREGGSGGERGRCLIGLRVVCLLDEWNEGEGGCD